MANSENAKIDTIVIVTREMFSEFVRLAKWDSLQTADFVHYLKCPNTYWIKFEKSHGHTIVSRSTIGRVAVKPFKRGYLTV